MNPRLKRLLGGREKLETVSENFVTAIPGKVVDTQNQTKQVFSDKWDQYDYGSDDFDKMVAHQRAWYLELYGFENEAALASHLRKCPLVLDAGAGKSYKAAWFAELSPDSVVIAADISDALHDASRFYSGLDNLFFVQCDIGRMPMFADGLFDYVSCDQVIHHTADPFRTFQELVRLTRPGGELSVYVYRKKALPRELVDDHFRELSRSLSHDELMELSRQITELGRLLSSLEQELEFPDIPLIGVDGGRMTVQRFIYWNFLKCFWNEEQGFQNSLLINYDWYSPSQAFRYSESEFRQWIESAALEEIHFHREPACYSGRFSRP